MNNDHIAVATVRINAPKDKVWDALVNPEMIKKYMFGAVVKSGWRIGDDITWEGKWKEKPYKVKGKIVKMESGSLLQFTHYSPLNGLPDLPENYHNVTYTLSESKDSVSLMLEQDNNPDEKTKQHSEANWQKMLEDLKKILETP